MISITPCTESAEAATVIRRLRQTSIVAIGKMAQSVIG
jgi:hypothetical protein